jgi:HlyD family secretion protein
VLFLVALTLYFQRDRIAQLFEASEVEQPAVETVADTERLLASVPEEPAGSISAAGYLEIIPPGPTVASTLVAGKVSVIRVVPGQHVVAGEVIALLDSSLLKQEAAVLSSRVHVARSQLERMQAGFRSEEIMQAAAELSSAQALLVQARADWERGQQLFEKGVIARQTLDAHQASIATAEAAVESHQAKVQLLQAGTRQEDIRIAEASLSAAQAELNNVQWEIAQCTVTAPVDGVVLGQFVQPGHWVVPGTDNPQSAAIASIFDPQQVQAWVDLNQRDSGAAFTGQAVELTTDANPQRPIAGVVKQIMPQANLQKNTVQVKIAIPDPPPDFRPELSVKVVFLPPEEQPGQPDNADPGADQELPNA